jgi:hypothetical protein
MCILDDYLGCNPSFGPDDFKRIFGFLEKLMKELECSVQCQFIFPGLH